ncbi:BamA/TamA family outer membrane protein [Flammeovirga pacifica]|nr:BamA/TamA family outer membrane protein [Flammeovirga pacifica]
MIFKSRVNLFALLLLFLMYTDLSAQDSVSLKWDISDYTIKSPIKNNDSKIFQDSTHLVHHVDSTLFHLKNEGYLFCTIDTVVQKNKERIYSLYLGPKYDHVFINTGKVGDQILNSRLWKGNSEFKKVVPRHLEKAKYQVVEYYENQGYPFTKVWTDSMYFKGNDLYSNLNIDLGDKVIFDTLIVKRDRPLGVHKQFFERYLGLKKGESFSQRNVDRAEVIIKQTPYLKLTDSIDVVFEYGRAMVEIPLEKRKASRADGLIGLAPNESDDGSVLVTGQVLLDIHNPFGTGKRFFIDWKKPDQHSQWFKGSYEHPRFFKSKMDVGYNINLQIQDSTFIKVANEVLLKRRVGVKGAVQLGVKWESSRLLRELNEQAVDTLNDTKSTLYSVGYMWQDLDDLMFPTRGFKFFLKGAAGQRNIIYNPSFDQAVYEGIPEQSLMFDLHLEIEYYFGLLKWMDAYLKVEGAQMITEKLFKNELYRLGGFNSIRGFIQGEFFVDKYAYITFEPRINMGGNSYLFAFSDIGITSQNEETDIPIGIGAGASLETKTGIFSIAYAIGKNNQIPFSTQLAKIHFGFIGVF